MERKDIKKYKIPDAPGVYMFRGTRRKLLYIGKATSLRSRVRSYFARDIGENRGPLIVKMLEEATTLEWTETESVLEALILEANLIKEKEPIYNSKEKDNKSFNYLVITREDFPRVLVVRGRDLFSKWSAKDSKYVFGPFPQGGILKDALKIVRKIFPFRDKCNPKDKKACFNKQLGLCPGVCDGTISKQEYGKRIQSIKLLFEGKKQALIKKLKQEMKTHSKKQEFEKAAAERNQIASLAHIKETSLIGSEYRTSKGGSLGRIEAYDVAHISETSRVGVMVVVQDGVAQKNEYKRFAIKKAGSGDTAALKEILERRLGHPEWGMPHLIVVDGSKAQMRAAESVLMSAGLKIPVVGVTKDARHKQREVQGSSVLVQWSEDDVLLANAEAHRFALAYHQKKRSKSLVDRRR